VDQPFGVRSPAPLLPACVWLACLPALLAARPRWVLSANENKLDLATGVTRVLSGAPPDTLTLLDCAVFPPRVTHLTNVANTVVGPPSNVALTPDGTLAVIADSLVLDTARTNGWRPARRLHVLDLTAPTPRVVGEAEAGEQPSGLSFTRDGRFLFVANRAAGSVSAFARVGFTLRPLNTVAFAPPAHEVSDVAVSPDGRTVLAAVREGGHLRELAFDGRELRATDRKVSVYGRPYRVGFTPDGQLALTAGAGFGNGPDQDALTVVDLAGPRPRATDFVPLGSGPESLELSPDGRLAVAVLMNGSNLAATDPLYRDHGQLVLLERRGRTFVRRQVLAIPRIPEGVCFTPDGRHVIVQAHPDRELRFYRVRRGRLTDTGERVAVPGMPSGLRAQPAGE
jgi:DNA-binding beta-propeller fold protein YncE